MNANKKPTGAQRIWRVADLPPEREPATYIIQNEGDPPRTVTLHKRQRQVMDLLIRGPVYCASPVRVSDIVFVLKRNAGLKVETTMHPGDPQAGVGSHGIYTLKSRVSRVVERKAA